MSDTIRNAPVAGKADSMPAVAAKPVLWFEEVRRGDVGRVGGKNASLGEMVQTLEPQGIRVPPGFATTAAAYWRFVEANGLKQKMEERVDALAAGKATLAATGQAVRALFLEGAWPEELAEAIAESYRLLCKRTG